MAINRNRVRITANILSYTKSCLDFLCEQDKRSLSQEISFIVDFYIDNITKENKELKQQLEDYYINFYQPKAISLIIFNYCRRTFRKVLEKHEELNYDEQMNKLMLNIKCDYDIESYYKTCTEKQWNIVINILKRILYNDFDDYFYPMFRNTVFPELIMSNLEEIFPSKTDNDI